MKNIIKFTTDLILSDSNSNTDIGSHYNSMELIIHSGGDSGYIIWNYWPEKFPEDDDEEVIGLDFNHNNEVMDFDGVFSLPKEAIQLLKDSGYILDENLSEVFGEDYQSNKELMSVDLDKAVKRSQS
jgi:hypothetical protein